MLRAILQDRLHAMIDISDGLGRDAGHLVERSSLQIVLDPELIPLRTGADLQQALTDGEDYELLFTASGDVPEGLGSCPVTRIGTVSDRPEGDGSMVTIQMPDGPRDVGRDGWEHRNS
jgi:thiamine-monophosphate kinase